MEVLLTAREIIISSSSNLHIQASIADLTHVTCYFGVLEVSTPRGKLTFEAPSDNLASFVQQLEKTRQGAAATEQRSAFSELGLLEVGAARLINPSGWDNPKHTQTDGRGEQGNSAWQIAPQAPPDRSVLGSAFGDLIGLALVAVAFALFGWWTSAARSDTGEIARAGSLSPEELRVGDCFDDANWISDAFATDAEEVTEVRAQPCSKPHDFEVYRVSLLPHEKDAPFPGEERLHARIDSEVCTPRFDSFVGISYDKSTLYAGWLGPTPQSWEAGDRRAVCVVFSMNGDKLTGSMKGTKR